MWWYSSFVKGFNLHASADNETYNSPYDIRVWFSIDGKLLLIR